jgi:hypothetical protein
MLSPGLFHSEAYPCRVVCPKAKRFNKFYLDLKQSDSKPAGATPGKFIIVLLPRLRLDLCQYVNLLSVFPVTAIVV